MCIISPGLRGLSWLPWQGLEDVVAFQTPRLQRSLPSWRSYETILTSFSLFSPTTFHLHHSLHRQSCPKFSPSQVCCHLNMQKRGPPRSLRGCASSSASSTPLLQFKSEERLFFTFSVWFSAKVLCLLFQKSELFPTLVSNKHFWSWVKSHLGSFLWEKQKFREGLSRKSRTKDRNGIYVFFKVITLWLFFAASE